MLTFLQIVAILIGISIIGIILGYLFGKFSCKKDLDSYYIQKSKVCESEYVRNEEELNEDNNQELDILKDVLEENKEQKSIDNQDNSKKDNTSYGIVGANKDSSKEVKKEEFEIKELDKLDISEEKKNIKVSLEQLENQKNKIDKNSNDIKKDNTSYGIVGANKDSSKEVKKEELKKENNKKLYIDMDKNKEEIVDKDINSLNIEKKRDSNQEVNNDKNINNLKTQTQKENKIDTKDKIEYKKDAINYLQENIEETINEKTKKAPIVTTKEDSKEVQKPQTLKSPINGKADNLKKIKGIGVVIEQKLNDLGIYYFSQIAAWSEKEIKWVDSYLVFSGRIIREDWVGQAKILARGEETEFSKRVERGEVSTSKK